MPTEITLPLWLFVVLLALATASVLDQIFMPSVRWFLRRRVNRAINEVNTRLRISLRPFQLAKRQVLLDRLVYDTEVIEAMQEYARENDMPLELAKARVTEYAREIVPAFNAYIYFRIGYWLSKKLARLVYRVHVGFEADERLSSIDSEATVVFVMNHRSNMDYVLVSYLVSEESTLSYAVGEWARIWPLQTLIKAMGAFFVRRNSGDALYRKVLERYVHMATQEGVCQAVFPEGGLSHDGKLRPPKLGFLDYMLRKFDHTQGRDIVFVPVGINYDRVIEDRSLLLRREPGAQRKSAWFMLRTTWGFYRRVMAMPVRERRRRFGYAAVNFGKPRSTAQFCRERNIVLAQLPREKRFEAVGELTGTLMNDIARVMPVLPVALICTVMEESPEPDLTAFDIKAQVYDLIDRMQAAGAPIRESENPKERTIATAINALIKRGLLLKDEAGACSVNPDEAQLVRLYANSLAHWHTATALSQAAEEPLKAHSPQSQSV